MDRARLSTISRRQRLLGILRINKLLAVSVASASVGIRDNSRFDFLGQTTILGINFILFFSKDARGESWIHDGDGVDWSLFIVYGENYSQVQDFYDEIYGPPIYDVYDDDDQVEYGVYNGQVQDNVSEVGLHAVEDVQLEHGEEVAKIINFVFGDKAFDTFLNITCSYGLTRALCGESLSTK